MTIQQQLQSMATTMAELTQQNQELTKEVNRQRQQPCGEEQGQNSKYEGLRIMLKETSLEVPLLVGYHIWKGRWTKWIEPWSRWRIPWGEQIMWMTSSIGLIPPSLRPSRVIPYLPSSKCLPRIHMMGRMALTIILPCSRQPCISKMFQTKSYAKPFLLHWKAQPEYGLVNYHQTP